MILKGKYGVCSVKTENIESSAISQIIEILNQEWSKEKNIAIMPDVHSGKGCVIGFTMPFDNMIVPNLIGKDIGRGMFCVNLGNVNIDFQKLDDFIHKNVKYGFNIHEKEQNVDENLVNLKDLKILNNISNQEKEKLVSLFKKSIGSLGGGNHFIEINVSKNGDKYLVIHSGSRVLGTLVHKHYQNLAVEEEKKRYLIKKGKFPSPEELINQLKNQKKEKTISVELEKLKKELKNIHVNEELAYLTNDNLDDYLHDMKICQNFALENRKRIANQIIKFLGVTPKRSFNAFHNYIDLENKIIRKGSSSALKGEDVIIPISMADGSILGKGKGNKEWNYSAPHGAGRVLSRSKAKEMISMNDYEESMKGIYTSCVEESTLDESKFAYKTLEEISNNIKESVEIIEVIRPLYNFKAH